MMNRRDTLRFMAWGTISAGVMAEACNTADKKATINKAANGDSTVSINRMTEEEAAYKSYISTTFFTKEEMAAIAVLCDIIIPKDSVSGSATDAKVPDFIEYIVKEKTEFQTPLRGGLKWLNLQSINMFQKPFKDCSSKDQLVLVDQIAYPKKATTQMKAGAAFFSLMRNLTATGFYTSEIGVKDVGYLGNRPNQWNGVPDEILKQYGLSYSEKELKECISFS